jgi:diadenosine tetraphosphate (Ap4A) HIT family hydrolase
MEYNQALQSFNKTFCPFCNEKPENIVEITNYFYILATRAPYTQDHLLVVPRRHICLIKDLKNKEAKEMYDIIEKRTERLHKKHKDIDLLLRDGLTG